MLIHHVSYSHHRIYTRHNPYTNKLVEDGTNISKLVEMSKDFHHRISLLHINYIVGHDKIVEHATSRRY